MTFALAEGWTSFCVYPQESAFAQNGHCTFCCVYPDDGLYRASVHETGQAANELLVCLDEQGNVFRVGFSLCCYFGHGLQSIVVDGKTYVVEGPQ